MAGMHGRAGGRLGAACGVVLAVAAAALAGPAAAAPVPVVRCVVTYGIEPPPGLRVPARVSSPLPAGRVAGFAAYMEPETRKWVLAPRGRRCRGALGANGTLRLVAAPPGAGARGVGVQLDDAAVSAGLVSQMACPWFPRARLGFPCAGRPPGERFARAGATAITFTDPPGVSGSGIGSGGALPVRGAVWFRARPFETAARVSCREPARTAAVCAAVIEDFLQRRGAAGPNRTGARG